MFAIAYFVTTTTCLSGANTLKRKACATQHQAQEDQLANSDSAATYTSASSKPIPTAKYPAQTKKQGKKIPDSRKAAAVTPQAEKKLAPLTPASAAGALKPRHPKSLCSKV